MLPRISVIIWLWVFLLVGCTAFTLVDKSNSDFLAPLKSQIKDRGQMLPIGATAIIGEETIELEVAETSEQQKVGLMYRTSLSNNRGMIFIFKQPIYPRFWMKNVKIPLDMIFLRDGKIKEIASNVPPCSADPCPSYGPPTLIDWVIELRGQRAAELGIKIGDRIQIKFLNKP
jgi:uncharacterized protein